MNEIVVEFSHNPIPEGCIQRLDEKVVKKHGQVWYIHKNDVDPFPSRPHAHNKESGLKLHLGTGELFFRTKSTGTRISKKDLIFIREKLSGWELPALSA